MKSNLRQFKKFVWGYVAVLLCAAAMPDAARAITVNPLVTSSGGFFHYDYAITNDSTLSLSVVTIGVPASAFAVANAMAPTGFSINFDVRLGLLDFLENSSSFSAGRTVSGFRFDSPFGPTSGSFTAVALDAAGSPVNFSGQTSAPGVLAAIPEPDALLLLSGGGLLMAIVARRRRAQSLP